MATVELDRHDTDLLDDTLLSDFCEEMFASLNRSDQRRWGKTYVQGLVNVPGRKSIRRMSRFVAGQDADQSLQQFLNQSPWSWAPVRSALAGALSRAEPPAALVVREVTFPKNGSSSVAVARQYSRSMGRPANCQLATGVFLTWGTESCPVNWRLHIPREWDTDSQRRLKSRVPESERWQPSWRIVLEVLEEMAAGWRLPALPVVVDLSTGEKTDLLLDALEASGTAYLAKVSPCRPMGPAGQSAQPPLTAEQVAVASVRSGHTTVTGRAPRPTELARSVFTRAPALAPVPSRARRHPAPGRVHRQILADWSWGPSRPRALWLTNLTRASTTELARLARMWDRSTEALADLERESGLLHFEGRSFPGWHHHVTLVSLAHGFRRLSRLHEEPLSA